MNYELADTAHTVRTLDIPRLDPRPSSKSLSSLNPATLGQIGTVAITTATQVDGMVARAHGAFAAWRTDREARRRFLTDCARELYRSAGTLAPLLTMEQGKPLDESDGEIRLAAKCLAEAAHADWDDDAPAHTYDERSAVVEHRPVGVVAVLVPWDLPILRMAAKIGPALVTGNTVVVEPPCTVALSVARAVDILKAVLPEGVLDIAVGTREAHSPLVAHPKIRRIAYVGSRGGARTIISHAARFLTPVAATTACGGTALLLPDADVENAATALAEYAFTNSGQTRCAPKSAYVPTDIVDDFCEAFAGAMRTLTVGDGMDPETTVGPQHSAHQLSIAEDLLRQSITAGSALVAGGGRGTDLPGYFLEPTLLRDTDGSTDFEDAGKAGPVFTVIGYDDIDRIVDRINEHSRVLSVSVWGADLDRTDQVAERVDAESVSVNRHDTTEAPAPLESATVTEFGMRGGRAVDEFLHSRVITH
ncbi:aldehyde dehydrogenase (NAD+) [Rhodococcus sp. OK611]|uniref:aldehyde dehydrogenase family protein n=1 Tax=unclassified Rhodococcus (in: high G+C Gram-positive bacteria) TaxID=192944 RepID=UPI000BD3AAF3|nr:MULTISPECIES: aldehyde dehydrogenase family protein [unclassified Rhodococcus (in: high G+C Gram-positive bacteria)]PTR43347.1 aldehyde dehydrogenase (NAD+) [Rhodococcus sp. OK611]SNX91210.1 aldehyde dehydrogenase (NAD+) [Rhodococcus sp. OK270]